MPSLLSTDAGDEKKDAHIPMANISIPAAAAACALGIVKFEFRLDFPSVSKIAICFTYVLLNLYLNEYVSLVISIALFQIIRTSETKA